MSLLSLRKSVFESKGFANNIFSLMVQKKKVNNYNVCYSNKANKFEIVFTLPVIKYIAVFNRLKVYHIGASCMSIPCCGILENLEIFPHHSLATASFVGMTGLVLLGLSSLPLQNTIGFLYISEDNKEIKISSVDFWGRRKNEIVPADDWVPLLDMKPSVLDAIYLTPQLLNGTKYKLFIKFGNVINSHKMSEVLE